MVGFHANYIEKDQTFETVERICLSIVFVEIKKIHRVHYDNGAGRLKQTTY